MAFLSLPEDVLMEVLAPARPIDILALGQTCKAVYRVTSERIVWERKLRNLVKHRNLYAPSLCPHDSTLGALQRTLLKRLSVPPEALEGSATELIREKTAVYFEPDSGTPYLCLVPGGRYLFTGLEKGRDPLTIKLWDLGPVGMPILSAPVLLSQYEIRFDGTPEQPYRDVSFAVWVSDLDALDLRLVAVFTRMGVRNGGVFVAKVFAISPGNPNPEFKELGSLYCDVRPEQRTALILPIRLHWEGWYADWSEEGDTAEYYMVSSFIPP
ncbi:hypothetical protein DFP72DRAFT_901198 [Ephemerocybe angulata]|uniref:F-box domain-containing protein n=1 Tax=Ephemerocybe angulata TaxID=980116 RepID=A0A8H6HW85_9AGAR|nr:hypothetical protein DFP72DRAFT_901198 [Tulosesus angulatus]